MLFIKDMLWFLYMLAFACGGAIVAYAGVFAFVIGDTTTGIGCIGVAIAAVCQWGINVTEY